MSGPVLDATIALGRGTLALDVTMSVGPSDVVAVLGPNGAGKSTLLRAVAGLSPIDAGRIAVDGVVVDDPDAGVFVAPADRGIGVVFQDHLLFPHLHVLDNVAFGLRARGIARAAARSQAGEWLERLGIADLGTVRPAALSGGQAQRVALARALVLEPALVLLDEPLASLDVQARDATRAELHRQLTGRSGACIVVTHDPVDALVLADHLVVLDGGRVVQAGPTGEVAARPRTDFVADIVGINLLVGTGVGGRRVRLAGGFELALADDVPTGDVGVAVRPRAVVVALVVPEGSARNRWEAIVASIDDRRDRVRVQLDGPVPVTAELTPSAVDALGLVPGLRVWASVKAVDLDAYPV